MADSINKINPQQITSSFKARAKELVLGEVEAFAEGVFAKYTDGRRKDFTGFFKDKPSEDQTKLTEKLAGSPAVVAAIKAALVEVTDPGADDSKITLAKTEFDESMKSFNEILSQSTQKYSAVAIIASINQHKDAAIQAIKAQQKAEVNALKAKLDTVDDALKAATNLANVAEVKASIVADLEKAHAEELKSFNESTNKSLEALYKSAEAQIPQFALLAHLYNSLDKKNSTKLEIENKAKKLRHDAGLAPNEVTVTANAKGTVLTGLSLSSLGNISTFTGKELEKNQDGTYTLKLGRHFFNPGYYLDPMTRSNPLADMILLATTIKADNANNAKGITLRLSFDDTDVAEKRGREAFEACIIAGFPLEKIKIVVNGKEFHHQVKTEKGGTANTIETELFKNSTSLYQRLLKDSKSYQAETEKRANVFKESVNSAAGSEIAKIKTEVTGLTKNRVDAAKAAKDAKDAEEAAAAAPGRRPGS